MDSATLLGLGGITGTLLGAFLGARGAIGAAKVSSRGQADVEEQKARRQAYYTCSTNLLARQAAASALLDTFIEDTFDLANAQVLLQRLDDQRDSVARAVGAVAAEGPYAVASNAEFAVAAMEHLAGRLRDWVTSVTSGTDPGDLRASQMRYALQDLSEVRQGVSDFTQECRKVLHPNESSGLWEPGERTRRLRLRSR